MATYQGYLAPSLDVHTPTRSASFALGTIPTPTAWKGILRDRATSGTLTDNLPVAAVPALTFQGVRACSFVDDFYNNVYIQPENLDFGSITDDVQRQVHIWNAFLTSTSVDALTPNGPVDDLTVGGFAIPGTLLPLQTGTVTFTALKDGPSLVQVEYTFQFSQGEPLVATLSGRRSEAWPFSVNWKRPFKVSYQYETEILTSHSGKEQRRSVLQEPRKSLEFSVMIRDEVQFEQFRRLMFQNHNEPLVLPEVTRRVSLGAELTSGGQSFTLATVPTWLQADLPVMLLQAGQSATNVIDTVVGNTITLKSPVKQTWSAKALLTPGLTCRVQPRLNTQVHTDSVGELSLVADVVPGSEAAPFTGSPALTLKGREVFLKKPNWAKGIRRTDEHAYETVDFGAGTVAYHSPINFATVIQQMDFLNRNTTQADDLINFFHRLRGRWGECYFSNRNRDMTLVEPITSGDTVLRIKNQEILFYKDEPTRAAILIQLNDQSVIPLTIANMTQVNDGNGSDTLVTVGETVNQSVALEDVERISWLMVWRLGSDKLTMEWVTDSVAQTRLSMQSLEDLAEE